MGFFWDLIQQNEIDNQKERASTLENRVKKLEIRMTKQQRLLRTLLERLEQQLGEDLDQDGRIGA